MVPFDNKEIIRHPLYMDAIIRVFMPRSQRWQRDRLLGNIYVAALTGLAFGVIVVVIMFMKNHQR